MTAFFEKHPDIEQALVAYFRTRRLGGGAPEPKLSAGTAVRAFHWLCRQRKLHEAEPKSWPYNTSRMGENAIRTYYQKWRSRNQQIAVLNEQGEAALKETKVDAAVARHPSLVAEAPEPLYWRHELDELSIPCLSGVYVRNKLGLDVLIDARRVHVLFVTAVRIPLILAARVASGPRYDTNDVLATMRQVLYPPSRLRHISLSGEFSYLDKAAYPAEMFPSLKGNICQELAWDADSAHISASDSELIKTHLGCNVAGERIGSPTARQMVERLNGFFSRACSSLVSATGTNPWDVARRNPEEAVAKYDVRLELLVLLVDIWARNWNATVLPSLGMTPLEATQQLIEKEQVFYNPFGGFDALDRRHVFYPSFKCNLTFSRKTHGVLVVNLLGAKYTSAELAGNALLCASKNKSCTFYVNDEDARIGWVVPDAYPELRIEVQVQDRRLRAFPHPLLWRQITAARQAEISRQSRAITPDVMLGFAQYLGESAEKTKDKVALGLLSAIATEQARAEMGGEATALSGFSSVLSSPPVLGIDESDEAEEGGRPKAVTRKRRGTRSSGQTAEPQMQPKASPPFDGSFSTPYIHGSDLGLGL